jgi:general secretion pathway protein A
MDQMTHRPDEMAGYLDFLMHRRRVESSNSLLQHFGFREDPFRVNPDARYLFPSKTHLQALSSLENGFYNNRGFIAMIAPPGMGKTTLLYRFLEDTKDTARSIFIFDIDAECKPRDFVGYILRDFGIKPARSSSEMHKQLSEALIKETEAGRKCVVVIDEAQNLSDAVLERVRLLTNFENSQGKLLQIILSGQPQLTDKLKKASLVQLRQRVSTICHLKLLSLEETKQYIDYRLGQAGYEGEPLFSDDALELIAEIGGGTPRTINNLCFNTLAMCSAMQCKQADREMVAQVAESMDLDRPKRKPRRSGKSDAGIPGEGPWTHVQETASYWWHAATGEVKVWVPAVIGVLVLAGLLVMRFTSAAVSQPARTDVQTSSIPQTVSAPAKVADQAATAKPAVKMKPLGILPVAMRTGTANQPGSNTASKLPPRPVVKATPGEALLTIDSNPAGADIDIDGAFVGNAPSTITLGPGSHQISVGKKGFHNWNKTLSVTGGRIHLNAELEQETTGQ